MSKFLGFLIILATCASFAEVKFKKKRIILVSTQTKKTKKITVEIADTPAKTAHGLMYRKFMSKDEGMFFIFKAPRILSFWMKNTFIPLSIAYIDKDKKIIQILDMKPMQSVMQVNFPSYSSAAPAQYALEMNRGWFKKNGFAVGDAYQTLDR